MRNAWEFVEAKPVPVVLLAPKRQLNRHQGMTGTSTGVTASSSPTTSPPGTSPAAPQTTGNHKIYIGDGSINDKWPSQDQWVSFDQMYVL
jgi:hypothetical protein